MSYVKAAPGTAEGVEWIAVPVTCVEIDQNEGNLSFNLSPETEDPQ